MKKFKGKRVVWKEAEGRIWCNIWVEIPRIPKPMRREVAVLSVSYLTVYREGPSLGGAYGVWVAQRGRGVPQERGQQCSYHNVKARAPSLSLAAATLLLSAFSGAPSPWGPNKAPLPGELTTAESRRHHGCYAPSSPSALHHYASSTQQTLPAECSSAH